MNKLTVYSRFLITLLTVLIGADSYAESAFNSHWNDGQAEIAVYNLKQQRYGTIRTGQMVAIWVVEDFSKSKQVKLDYPGRSPEDLQRVLKLNEIRRFETGIYDYSLMRSSFLPLSGETPDQPVLLKTALSIQDWCGQTFTQLNQGDSQFRIRQQSYFESEGDRELETPLVFTEDQVMIQGRIDPKSLPVGRLSVLPSLGHSVLYHRPLAPGVAQASLSESDRSKKLLKFTLTFKESGGSTTTWYFEKNFPHQLQAIETRGSSGELQDLLELVESRRLPYWQLQREKGASIRREMGIDW